MTIAELISNFEAQSKRITRLSLELQHPRISCAMLLAEDGWMEFDENTFLCWKRYRYFIEHSFTPLILNQNATGDQSPSADDEQESYTLAFYNLDPDVSDGRTAYIRNSWVPITDELSRLLGELPEQVNLPLPDLIGNWWRVVFALVARRQLVVIDPSGQWVGLADEIPTGNLGRATLWHDGPSHTREGVVFSDLRDSLFTASETAIRNIVDALRVLMQGESEVRPSTSKTGKGVPLEAAEIRVRDYLTENAKNNPSAITRDGIAQALGISAGLVSKTKIWQAFQAQRKENKKPKPREIPLNDKMQATIPIGERADPAELAALIEDQRADEDEQTQRYSRRHHGRHTPS